MTVARKDEVHIHATCYREINVNPIGNFSYCYTIQCWSEASGHAAYEQMVQLARRILGKADSYLCLTAVDAKALVNYLARERHDLIRFSKMAARSPFSWSNWGEGIHQASQVKQDDWFGFSLHSFWSEVRLLLNAEADIYIEGLGDLKEKEEEKRQKDELSRCADLHEYLRKWIRWLASRSDFSRPGFFDMEGRNWSGFQYTAADQIEGVQQKEMPKSVVFNIKNNVSLKQVSANGSDDANKQKIRGDSSSPAARTDEKISEGGAAKEKSEISKVVNWSGLVKKNRSDKIRNISSSEYGSRAASQGSVGDVLETAPIVFQINNSSVGFGVNVLASFRVFGGAGGRMVQPVAGLAGSSMQGFEYPASPVWISSDGVDVQQYDLGLIARIFFLAKAAQTRLLLHDQMSRHHFLMRRVEEANEALVNQGVGPLCELLSGIEDEQ